MIRGRPLFDAKRVLSEALSRWHLSGSRVAVLSDRDNLVYRIEPTSGELAVLRLIHSDRRPVEQVEAELRFVAYLDDHDVHVAAARPSLGGRLVEPIDAHHGYFSACLLRWAPGQRVTYRSSAWSDDLLRSWGRVMGRIHALAKAYEPVDGVPARFAWSQDDVWTAALVHLPSSEPAARDHRVELQGRMEQLPRSPETFGLIHGDLTGASFRVMADRLTVFDFDDCCRHWFVYDIAVALWGYRLLTPDERARLLTVWLAGYAESNELDPLWKQTLGTFFELRALYLLARSYRDYDDEALPDRERRQRNAWRHLLESEFSW